MEKALYKLNTIIIITIMSALKQVTCILYAVYVPNVTGKVPGYMLHLLHLSEISHLVTHIQPCVCLLLAILIDSADKPIICIQPFL